MWVVLQVQSLSPNMRGEGGCGLFHGSGLVGLVEVGKERRGSSSWGGVLEVAEGGRGLKVFGGTFSRRCRRWTTSLKVTHSWGGLGRRSMGYVYKGIDPGGGSPVFFFFLNLFFLLFFIYNHISENIS